MNSLGSEVIPTYKSFDLNGDQSNDPDVLIRKFSEAFSPTTNTTFNTFEFLNKSQRPDENFSDFFSRLQIAAKSCKFNDSIEGMSCETRLLRDKIVMGIQNDETRKISLTDL